MSLTCPPMPRPPRLPLIDALRGFAVAQMVVYHFIYDLNYFGWAKLAMTRDQPWVGWRTAIVTQFLLLVGVGLVLRSTRHATQGAGTREFWRRWAQVAGAAALVSAGSWFVFGPRYIWFGILHFIAAALVIGRAAVPLGVWNIALGIAVIVVGNNARHNAIGGERSARARRERAKVARERCDGWPRQYDARRQ